MLLLGCSRAELQTRVVGSPSDGIVFVRVDGASKDVARARLSDGAVALLGPTPERDEDWPYWSQEAARLLLQVKPAGVDANSDLVLFDPATGREQPLLATPGRDEQWPNWSPDGRQVAFAFRGASPASGIGLVDVATGAVRVAATSGPQNWFFRPHFAPDSLRLVAQKRWGDSPGSSLWLLQAGRSPRALRDDRASWYQKPWFSRDGKQIVYTMRPSAGGLREIYVLDVDGSGTPRVVASAPDADDHSAMPSPTRDEVAFVSNRDGSMDIFLADLSGGGLRNLTHTPEVDEYAPHWSPDGERLVVTLEPARTRPPGGGDDVDLAKAKIRVIDRDGTQRLETPGVMPDWMPAWP